MKSNSVATLVLVSLVLCLAFPSSVLAQGDAPVLIGVNLVQVKPDMMDRFLDLHKEVFLPAGREQGDAFRVTTATVFGHSFEVAVARPITNYAQLDQPPGGLTETESALAGELWNQCVDSRRAFIVQARPDLSMEAAPTSDLQRRVRIVVKSGKVAEFEALFANEVLPAIAKSGVKGYQVFQTVLGGNTSEYWALMPIGSFASLDGWSIFQGLSADDATRLNTKATALIDTLEISITRLNRDLSYGLPGME